MKILSYFALILLLSCATQKKETPLKSDAPEDSGLPTWVVEPEKGCIEKHELCASSEAKNSNEADLNAKKALASIFETKISTKFKMKLASFEGRKSDYRVQEEVKEEIEESVAEVLKGVEIKKRFKHNNIYFSLASLDKDDAEALLSREIGILDERILYNLKQKKRSMYEDLLIFAEKREMLYQKYLLLDKGTIEPPYSSQDIENLRYASSEKKKISIKSSESLSNELLKYIENRLTNNGYEITEENSYFYKVVIKWKETPLKINVEGFRKVNYELDIEVRDNSYQKVGGILISETGTGRTNSQAFISVKEKIKKLFSDSFSKLNMY